MTIDIPEELQPFLGNYGPQGQDPNCGETITWGYPVIRQCGDEIWSKLSALGSLECIHGSHSNTWILVTKFLTQEEAIAQYGEITDEEFGPRGGWKSITFGEKKFISKFMKPGN